MIILKILLWILLAVLILLGFLLLLIFIALILPVKLKLLYENQKFLVKIKILFFKKQIYPPQPKKQKSKKVTEINLKTDEKQKNSAKEIAVTDISVKQSENKTSEQTQKTNSTAKSNNKSTEIKADNSQLFKLAFDKIGTLVSTATGFLRLVFKHLKFKDIIIYLPVYNKDPAKNAIDYGKVNAYFYSLVANLENFLYLRFKKVDIFPDFKNENENKQILGVTICGNALGVLIAFVWALKVLIKEKIIFPNGFHLIKNSKQKVEVTDNERKRKTPDK